MFFAGIDLKDYIIINEIENKVMPNIKNFSKDIPGMDGEYFTRSKLGIRTITVKYTINTLNKYQLIDRLSVLAKILQSNIIEKLYLIPHSDKFYYAKVSDTSNLNTFYRGKGRGSITFTC
ncbi:MAG: phage tail family protein, partial [Clostridium saudiense]|nr:phage tail family protein [Clostridium saudiense]